VNDISLLKKIMCPTLPAILLHRQTLVASLQEAMGSKPHQGSPAALYKLILCCAPAGYGKTTLLADSVYSTSLPCCWYFLESVDTDPTVFLNTLLASIRSVFPQFGVGLDSAFRNLLSDDSVSAVNRYHTTLDILCEALATEISERFALLLSNYEAIDESDILTELVNFLLKKLPPQATLIIESRVIPRISFTPFVIHDEMCGLDRENLRFSAQEIAELARLQGLPPLADTEAEHLATSFDGWIAGILLGTRLGDVRFRQLTLGTSQNKPARMLQGKSLAEYQRNMLFTYVVDDVLKQDIATYTFLQNISILQHIDPAMCDALLGSTDASERLAHLERQGIFLTMHENDSSVTYTCHPVIRDLLSEQLRSQQPERFLELHRQAAALWHANHNDEQAIYHALAIKTYDVAASFILDASEFFLQQGRRETLIRWLDEIPSTVQERSPQLLLLQATLDLRHGLCASALLLLDKAEALVAYSTEAETKVLRSRIIILRSKALFQVGEYAQAEMLCKQVLQYIPMQEHALRAAAEMRWGICANLQGQFTTGITHLQRALNIWANQPPLSQAMEIHRALANTYYWVGNFLLAQYHLTQMLDICEQLQDVLEKGNALILQGLIAQDQGLAAEAEALFLQVLQFAHTIPHAQRNEAYALANLGSLAVEQGQYVQALTYIERGLTLARTFGNRSLINDALVSQALSYLFLGDPTSALLTAESIEVPESRKNTVGYELVGRDLTFGLIFLFQKRYAEAEARFTTIETALRTKDLKRGCFQVKLRLAACRLAQERIEEAVSLLEEVASLLAAHQNYAHLVRLELQRLPALLPVIQKYSQLAILRAQLGLGNLPHAQSELEAPHTPSDTHTVRLVIHAFGEPGVLLDEQPIKHWRMALAKELFFFLLDSDHPVSKETILTALWPEYDERTSKIFHDTIYQLRKLLGEACFVFSSTGYRLNLAACYGEQVRYDVQEFQQHCIDAEQALTRGNEALAKEAFLKMVQLYRGDYGRSFYNDWCTFRRDKLRTVYLEARRQLAQIAWRAEAWNESAEHYRQMLRLDDCLEEAHYGLMRCYVRQRKRGAALRQYRVCQKVLQEELDVSPGPAIQNLYEHLTADHHAE